jgi:hypothetical protein
VLLVLHQGRGAIDLVMAVKNCNFKAAVDWAKPKRDGAGAPAADQPAGRVGEEPTRTSRGQALRRANRRGVWNVAGG